MLIVDDSAVARAVIARAIAEAGCFELAGAVPHAAAARALLARERVDAILLDIEMPGVDGLTALPDLVLASHGARVIVVSSVCAEGGAATIQALALGAADTLAKPQPGISHARFAAMLVEKLVRLTAHDDAPTAPPPPIPRPVAPASEARRYDLIAIGASTGGIHALGQLLRAVPASFTTPILITQHLPTTFMPFFAAQVAVLASRPCDVATERMRLRPSRIVVAPGDAHVRCVALGDGGVAVRLSTDPAPSGCLPSVDVMFDSIATACGPRALAVVLSGMGRDGAIGARALVEAGGDLVVQDRESSVIWGMPGAVATAGLAHAILAPDAIGQLIASRRSPR
ncbi:chemotaxis protein CheB [uncultured Sphingomonas sp.]|uniref:chemotaxis protein CheB n=1 Tax=uncultured Sphingomonas sp. TaxID=158754 RepID=UPI0035C9D313